MTKNAGINTALAVTEKLGLINILQNTGRGTGQSLYVLTYHRVEELDQNRWLDPAEISTTPRQFASQMKLVADKYQPVSVEDVLVAAHGGPPLPKDAVLVTVDDGYCDFKDVIFPICKQSGIRPLLFQPTGFVGSGTYWWDKVFQIIHLSGADEIETPFGKFDIRSEEQKYAVQHLLLEKLRYMPFDVVMNWIDRTHGLLVHLTEKQRQNTLTWDDLRQLSRAGVTVACHTHTHPIMTQIPLEEARKQIRLSQEILQRELGHTLPIFAFPDGKPRAYNSELVDMLFSEGFEMVFLLVDGRAVIEPGKKDMRIPRLAVWQNQTLPQFHLRLTPIIDHVKSRV